MKERPILFSAPMVRAILDGTKTQTRRLVTAEHGYIGGRHDNYDDPALWGFGDIDGCWHVLDQSKPAWTGEGQPHESYTITCPFGQPGDRLWVRETWGFDCTVRHDFKPWGPTDLSGMDLTNALRFAASHTRDSVPKWRPSIHMPRWASRITLEVTDVRVDRLQAISDDDVAAEGIGVTHALDPQSAFHGLWDSLNADRAPWASNPWVWVISFKRVQP